MRVSPLFLWRRIYDYGYYNTSVTDQAVDNISEAHGYKESFLNWYCILENLSKITTLTDDSIGTFLMMTNATTHEQPLLQQPDYVPANVVENTLYDTDMVGRYTLDRVTMRIETENQVMHYDVNVVSMIKLAQWFDWMREQGVYDNTSIILVSDHGRDLGQFPERILQGDTDTEHVNAFLMVKDFNSTGFTIDYSFMTNADTAAFAVKDIIENPINPFTGNSINMDGKVGGVNVVVGGCIDLAYGNGFEYDDAPWYHVKDNIFDIDNWKSLDK